MTGNTIAKTIVSLSMTVLPFCSSLCFAPGYPKRPPLKPSPPPRRVKRQNSASRSSARQQIARFLMPFTEYDVCAKKMRPGIKSSSKSVSWESEQDGASVSGVQRRSFRCVAVDERQGGFTNRQTATLWARGFCPLGLISFYPCICALAPEASKGLGCYSVLCFVCMRRGEMGLVINRKGSAGKITWV